MSCIYPYPLPIPCCCKEDISTKRIAYGGGKAVPSIKCAVIDHGAPAENAQCQEQGPRAHIVLAVYIEVQESAVQTKNVA